MHRPGLLEATLNQRPRGRWRFSQSSAPLTWWGRKAAPSEDTHPGKGLFRQEGGHVEKGSQWEAREGKQGEVPISEFAWVAMQWGCPWGTIPAPLKSTDPNKCNKNLRETSGKVRGWMEGGTLYYMNEHERWTALSSGRGKVGKHKCAHEASDINSTSGICWAWHSCGCWPLLQKPGECDRGETRTGHHKENLAVEAGLLSSLESALNQALLGPWVGRGAQGLAQVKVAQIP